MSTNSIPSKGFILVVEDILDLQIMFISELRKNFPGYEIIGVDTLNKAQAELRSKSFAAVVTDCGFPVDDKSEREHGNTSGLTLIKEIREGTLGSQNQHTIIAFNSAEMDEKKQSISYKYGGKISCFKKGAIYPTIRSKNASQYTIENVTGQSISWLKEQFEILEHAPNVTSPQPASQPFGLRILRSLGFEADDLKKR
jgi:CheY-like chemotaxis protein